MTGSGEQISLYLTQENSCSYLPGQSSSSLLVDPEHPLNPVTYGNLLAAGFRRSGSLVYRPHCRECSACIACRVAAEQFRPNRSQRRNWRSNQDLEIRRLPGRLEDEHFSLYQSYQNARHTGGEMSRSSADQTLDFLVTHWCNTEFVEFRHQGRLLAVAVTDVLPDALSSVYTFFTPDLPRRALGVFAVLSQIRLAAEQGLSWLYLGYWIENCSKMRYKTAYQPIELWNGKEWHNN